MPGEATRTKILDAAERLFADHGYDGVSLRQITTEAGVQLAMVNYHFGSKTGLWERVFERRTAVLGERRLAMLAEAEAAGDRPTVEALITAFVQPLLEISMGGDPGWKNYARLIAQVANSGATPSLTTIIDQFDPVARRFIAAFRKALPERSEEEVVWSFHFLMGAMLHTFADTGRVDRLTNGRFRSADFARITAHMVPFLAAGFRTGTAAAGTPRRRLTATA